MRRRVILPLACLFIVAIFAAITYFISKSVILSGVNAIELQQAQEDMKQLRSFLRTAEIRLSQHTSDWACWDEAYDYVHSRDDAFIRNNLDGDRLREFHITGLAFFDLSGDRVAFVDGSEEGRSREWIEEEQRVLQNVAAALRGRHSDSLEGFVNVRGECMIVAAHTVYDSRKQQPARGVLVMAGAIDRRFIHATGEITGLRFSVLPASLYDMVLATAAPDANCKFLQTNNEVRVYSVLNDVFGKAAFCLELNRNRNIAVLGRQISLRNFWLMLGLGLLILLAGFLLLHFVHRRLIRDEMRYRAGHDSLTGLPKKNLFLERLTVLLGMARREKSCLGVLFVDMDRFKTVNDSLGYALGDDLLRETAARLRSLVVHGGVGRAGGDEFMLAITAANRQQIATQAQKVLAALDKPFAAGGNSLHLGASIGIAFFPGDGDDAVHLLHRAELAMFRSKEDGRNAVSLYESNMDADAFRKMELETELYRAVEEGSFSVNYQPKVDIASRDVAGCEALVRWQTGDGTLVPPPVFIPLAEEIGLVTRIDMFVLRSACRQVLAWGRDGSGAVPVAVNMSARSILSEGFADQVLRILEEGAPPSLIDIEITETCLMSDLDTAFAAISRLHEAGLHIALDDFGTGYSSLQYLSAMPISFLKIDKKFVDDIFSGKVTAQPLVKSILALASNLGMHTVSEGVEERCQLQFLAANGAHIIQGYLFSRPLTGAACGEFLRNRKARIAAVMDAA